MQNPAALPRTQTAPAGNTCACGSLLSPARCCALDPAALAASDAHRHLVPLEAQAVEANCRGYKAAAERLARDVLELAPGRVVMFPAAPLVHVIRHPLDMVLSVFGNLLTHGYYCAYTMESIAQHFVLIADLVTHYREQMNLRYLAVRYEDMVTNQEATIRQILDFVGTDFDPRCLAFHENRRYARTASYAQVSEKLYGRSRFRYVNYLPQLEPVISILQPVIDRLGYTV